MLVYGDRIRTRRPREMLAQIAALERAARAGDAALREERLTQALIAAGELAQGLADSEFEACGVDDLTPTQGAAMALCTALARQLLGEALDAGVERDALAAAPLPAQIGCKVPEGYAFYAVYPQAYADAARAQVWGGPPLVIGLRSIGVSLAAMVAAATGGRAISVRPSGHPFAREIRASPDLRAALQAHAGPFVIADEGPGLSGSSFGAAADLLESLGVAPARIVFLPSHAGDLGPQASARHRRRWAAATRPVITLDDRLAHEPLPTWFGGVEIQEVEDLSAGAWRAHPTAPFGAPTSGWQERRKFRLTSGRDRLAARFAGLGAIGEAKLARAEGLAEAGFTPQPLALRRGFLLETWVEGSPLRATHRRAFLAHLARYLGYRAQCLPARTEAGASLSELREMAVVNIGEACGPQAGERLEGRLAALTDGIEDLRLVQVDGRLQAWEWRIDPQGRFCKTDALDHCEGHDLVGCQDIAWDVAGAVVEYDLSAAETERLAAVVEQACARKVDPAAIGAFTLCYAAFQVGSWWMTRASLGGPDAEAADRQVRRYAGWLQHRADLVPPPRPANAVDEMRAPGA